jgi:hypothetical protein
MRAQLQVILAVLGVSAATLNACQCSNTCNAPTGGSGGAEAPCYGGCGCGGGCYCDTSGQRICSRAACIPTCIDDAGVTQYPGAAFTRNGDTCTCDYNGNINCCPNDGGACTSSCIDSNGSARSVGETWTGGDGGSCSCKTGFIVDCGAPPAPAHCSFAGVAYRQGAAVDAGAGCSCNCNDQGHVMCSAAACLPSTCSYQGSSYSTGLIFQSGDCNFCLCGDDGAMSCTGRVCGGGKCEYAGTTYDAGTSFPSADGCNTCTCDASGSTSCTSLGCAAVHCVVDGGAVAVGTTFLTSDKCNVCGCSSDGKVYCTARPCTP